MRSKKGYKNDKTRTSTGKWLKYYFLKFTCRGKENKNMLHDENRKDRDDKE